MHRFTAVIRQFANQGEKTGWTYIDVPREIAEGFKPSGRKSIRAKGKLDKYSFRQAPLFPTGKGNFIMTINAAARKAIGKGKGAMVDVQMEVDKTEVKLCPELLECLADEPAGSEFFNSLTPSHQLYFSRWIESAKTEPTRTRRIAQTIIALSRRQGFGEMSRALRDAR